MFLIGKEEFLMRLFTLMFVAIFIVFFIFSILAKNYEFIFYDIILLSTILFAYFIHKKIRLHLSVFASFSAVILIHALGGISYFNGIRLYDIVFGFVRYDNIVHFLSSFTIVFIIYNLIYDFLDIPHKNRGLYLFMILVLMTTGFGTFIEFAELFAVVFLNAEASVGGYINNAVDLVVNFIGAAIASLFVIRYHTKKLQGSTL